MYSRYHERRSVRDSEKYTESNQNIWNTRWQPFSFRKPFTQFYFLGGAQGMFQLSLFVDLAKRADTFGNDYDTPLFKYIPLYSLGYSIGQSRAAQAHSAPKKQRMMKERSRKKTYAWIMVSRIQCKIIVIIIRAYMCVCGCVRCVCECECENVCSSWIEVAAHAHLRVWVFSIFEMIVSWEWVW